MITRVSCYSCGPRMSRLSTTILYRVQDHLCRCEPLVAEARLAGGSDGLNRACKVLVGTAFHTRNP